jgi:hypothetical protein
MPWWIASVPVLTRDAAASTIPRRHHPSDAPVGSMAHRRPRRCAVPVAGGATSVEVGSMAVLRRWCAAAALATGALLATACVTGSWTGDADATSVSVIGDSLVWQAEGNVVLTEPQQQVLTHELAASGYRAHVSGWIGETIPKGYAELWPIVATEPGLDIVVIALGTNDATGDAPLSESRAALQTWLADAVDVGCVALVGVNEHATAWGLDIDGPPFNAMLAEEAALAPNAIFVPWEPDLDIHGHHGDPHLETPEAQAQYRATLHDAADQCAATLPPPG